MWLKELSIISIIFLLYGYFGYLMPGVFRIRGGSIARLVNHIYMIPEGIFGTCLGTSANYIVLFVIFGAFLEKSGLGSLIQDIAIGLTGRYAGGPAKVAVLSSALFGTVSGSAAANVVTTGAFTIPLMKRIGYEPEFAAAVEACSSTGGQIGAARNGHGGLPDGRLHRYAIQVHHAGGNSTLHSVLFLHFRGGASAGQAERA